MPTKIQTPCLFPGCSALTNKGSYCIEHQKAVNKNYEQSYSRALSKKAYATRDWKFSREKKLTNEPICELCIDSGRVTIATLVHHIDNNSSNNYQSNLMSLCSACHNVIHNTSNKVY